MKTATVVPTKKRLRIALLVDRFGSCYGGAEAYAVELMRVLSCQHDITVVARAYDSDLHLPYYEIGISAAWPSWIRVLYFAWRAARFTKGRFDIVHSHMNGWSGDVEVVHVTPVRYRYITQSKSILKRIKTWTSLRLLTYLFLEKARICVQSGRRLVAVSQIIASQLHQSYSADLPIEIITPGVKLPLNLDPSLRESTRTHLGWPPQTIACLLIARNPLRKGLHTLINTLKKLPENYHLLVVGADQITEELIKKLNQPILQNRISLIKPTSYLTPYFQAADIYVHPTLNDSFGMAPLEAMAHGLPAIVSAIPYCGLAEYLIPQYHALILKNPHSSEELAQLVQRLGSNTHLSHCLATQGRAFAATHNWPSIAARYETLYLKLLEEKKSSN